MKELMQFIRATADLALHKVGAFLRSHDPDLANMTGAEPSFEEMEATLERLAMAPEDRYNSRVAEWARREFGGLESWQLELILKWYGDQIINGPDGDNHVVSMIGQDQIVVRPLRRKR